MTDPWKIPETSWKTEAEFYSALRSIFRKGWSRWQVKNLLKKKLRKRIQNPNPKGRMPTVWGGECAYCKQDFPQNNLEVDHIIPAGSLRCKEDIGPFIVNTFFVGYDDLQLVCKPCHKIKTLADRNGSTFEEAKLRKEEIAFEKLSKKDQQKKLNQLKLDTAGTKSELCIRYSEWLHSSAARY